MAFFLATNVLSDTPPVLTPCICSSRSQYIQLDNIDGTQPYIIESKIRLFGNNPGSTGDDYLGNYADTSYGNSWRLYNNGGSYSSSGGWSRFQDSHNRIDKNPCIDTWFDLQEGPAIFKLGGEGNTYSFPTYTNADYPLCLFGLPDRPNNRSACALARTKITLNDVLVADLVPVNEFAKAVDLLNNGEYTQYSWLYLSSSISSLTPIRDTIRLDARYLDDEGVMHYAEPFTISVSDFASGGYDVRPYTTYDNGEQNQWVITNDRLYYQEETVPPHGVKVFADVYITGSTKEGQFYDTVNDKYYFSNTSTPLVYSEL